MFITLKKSPLKYLRGQIDQFTFTHLVGCAFCTSTDNALYASLFTCVHIVNLRCSTPVSPALANSSVFCSRFNSRRCVLISVSNLENWPSNLVNRSSCLARFLCNEKEQNIKHQYSRS